MGMYGTTYSETADPAYNVFVEDHIQIVTSFDLFYTDPDSFSMTFETSPKSLIFSDRVSLSDIHFRNDGSGNLVVDFGTSSEPTIEFRIANFESGQQISGWLWGVPPTALDGISELVSDQTLHEQPTVIPTEKGGTFVFYPVSPVYYRLKDFSVGGHTYDLTHGVPIFGTSGNDNLVGFGVNTFTGQAYNDTLLGGEGDDTLDGGVGNDVVSGEDGDDVIYSNSGIDQIDGGAGFDILYDVDRSSATGAINYNSINAAQSGITLPDGTTVKNIEKTLTLETGAGDDTLTVSQANGVRSWSAGSGYNTLVVDYHNAPGALYSGMFDTNTFETYDASNATFGYYYNVSAASLIGSNQNDTLNGTSGNDTIAGGIGDDTINGGLGADKIDGGDGFDTLSDLDKLASTNGIAFNATGAATQAGITLADGTTIKNIEKTSALETGAGDDTLTVSQANGVRSWSAGSGYNTLVVDYHNAPGALYSGMFDTNTFETYDASNATFGYYYNVSAASLIGSNQNDTLNGTSGNDTIAGGIGDDTINGGLGADKIDGGDGFDTLSDLDKSASTNGIAFNATGAATQAGITLADGTTIKNIEKTSALETGAGDDTLTVSQANGVRSWSAGSGYNTLVVDYHNAPGALYSGMFDTNTFETYDASNATFGYYYNVSAASLIGSNQNDTLNGTSGNDTIAGGIGDDTINGGLGADKIDGGDGFDTLSDLDKSASTNGIAFNATGAATQAGITLADGTTIKNIEKTSALETGAGDDTLTVSQANGVRSWSAGSGYNTLVVDYHNAPGALYSGMFDTNTFETYDASNATFGYYYNVSAASLIGSNQNDTLNGTSGNDTIAGGNGADRLDGGNGADFLTGGTRWDTLIGGDGDDVLDGGLDNDQMSGGLGNDIYYVDNVGDRVYENPNEGSDTIYASLNWSLSADVEALVLQGSANLTGTGNGLNNAITGNGGANTLSGGGGSDTLDGGAGADSLDGGLGNDVLLGGARWDTLIGGDGSDTLDGGLDNDQMYGGLGNDVYYVDNVGDRVYENASANEGSDTVYSSISWDLTANIEAVVMTGTGNTASTGNSLANTMTGNSGNNTFVGGTGHDTMFGNDGNDSLDGGVDSDVLNGGSGNDTLLGGQRWDTLVGGDGDDVLDGGTENDQMSGNAGNDVYYVDNVGDRVYENANEGNDTVYASIDFALSAEVENLVLTGAAITGTGNGLSNKITGNSNANTLSGGNGNDTLMGGAGNDLLTGGGQPDSFVFSAAASNGTDHIADFVHLYDHLVFTGSDYGLAAGHALTSAEFTVGTAAVGTIAQFIWNTTTHHLYFDADGTGSAAAFDLALIDGGASLAKEDLFFT